MPTILICEDEELIRWSLEQHLAGLGYHVAESVDGACCIERLTEPLPDLLILDLVMPRGGGRSVLEHLRRLPRRPPTLLLTARSPGHADVQDALADGVDAYLSKPFTLEEVAEKVAHLLARPPLRLLNQG